MLELIVSTLNQGLIWAVLALGVFLTFRILDIPDLTVEGSFPMGAGIAATSIVAGYDVYTSMLFALIGGAAAGAVTGLLTTKLKIPALLAGILSMIGLYSVNLHIMGRANISLLASDTVFTEAERLLPMPWGGLLVGVVFVFIITSLVYWFFGTEMGTAIRATGFNPQMARAQGINTNFMIVLGLMISNALVALCGSVVAQSNGFADIGMGVGTIVIGLASVIIGEVLFGIRTFKWRLMAVVLGSVVYRIVIAVVLELGLPTNDLKLFTALLVAGALALPLLKSKMQRVRR